MSTTVTTTQDSWEKRALECINGTIPEEIDREALQEAVWELEDAGPGELSAESFNILNKVLAHQSEGGLAPEEVQTPEQEAEPPQEPPAEGKTSKETGEIENAPQRQPEAKKSKPVADVESEAIDPKPVPKLPVAASPVKIESRRDSLRRRLSETIDTLVEGTVYKLGPNEYYIQHYELSEYERVSKSELRERIRVGCLYFPEWLDDTDKRIETDKFFEELFSKIKTVDCADPVAGYIEGYREYNGTKILVTKGSYTCVHDDLEEGDCSGLQGIFERMWGPKQIHYVYTWLLRVIQAMQSRTPVPIQFFALGGPPDSGKTWFQEVVLDGLLGGHESPSQFMDGDTVFNSKLFRVPHLMLSDQDGSPSIQKRRKFGGYIKRITSNKGLECHGKYDDEITLDPIRVPTCSFNTSPAERIKILPPLDDDIRDKMIITKVNHGKMPLPTATAEQELEFKSWTQAQLPALSWWLLNKYQPPVGILLDSRFGIKGYCHPDIEKHLFEMSPERRLRDFIDDLIFGEDNKNQTWKGSSSDLEKQLNKNEDARAFLRRQTGRFADMLIALDVTDQFKTGQ